MKKALFLTVSFLLQSACLPVYPQADGTPAAAEKKNEESKTSKPDLFDFSNPQGLASPEQEFLDLDESIKLKVEPVVRGTVVDRVIENSTIYVRAPLGSLRVEVYIEPVDAPFCGKSLGEPRLIGKSSDVRRNFPVSWQKPEAHRYVKVFAIAFKPGGLSGRSRSISLAMGGSRLQETPQTGQRLSRPIDQFP